MITGKVKTFQNVRFSVMLFLMKIIDKYIIKELFLPFVIGIIGFIVIMLSVRISGDINLIISEKIPSGIVFSMMLYKIPEYIVTGMPVAYLIATLLMLARLGKDNEITALRASGVNFKRMIYPILIISMIASSISFLLMDYVVPYSNHKSNSALLEAKKLKKETVTNDIQFRGVDSRVFSLRKIDQANKTMEGIMVYDTSKKKTEIITAERGSWNGKIWILQNGITHKYFSRDRKGVGSFVAYEEPFTSITVDAKIQVEDFITERKAQEMSMAELKEIINTRKTGGQDTKSLEVDYELKRAKPLASFFAALIAAPIGSRFSRFGGYIGVAISIILIFIYFATESITVMIGNLGVIPPFFAAWAPNLIFAVIGLALLWWVDQ